MGWVHDLMAAFLYGHLSHPLIRDEQTSLDRDSNRPCIGWILGQISSTLRTPSCVPWVHGCMGACLRGQPFRSLNKMDELACVPCTAQVPHGQLSSTYTG